MPTTGTVWPESYLCIMSPRKAGVADNETVHLYRVQDISCELQSLAVCAAYLDTTLVCRDGRLQSSAILVALAYPELASVRLREELNVYILKYSSSLLNSMEVNRFVPAAGCSGSRPGGATHTHRGTGNSC